MKLPTFDIDQIANLTEAKNAIEKLLHAFALVKKENIWLREEIARLKGQPKKPSFTSGGEKQSVSVTALLQEKKHWQKSSKGKLPIDREEQLSQVEHCECGSTQFKSLRTTTKVVQGIILKRNNVAYHGRQKQCMNCGKKYKSILPSELKGVSFDKTLCCLVSFFKYGCRMTYPLIHRMLTGFGIQISYGEINAMLLRNGDELQPAFAHLRTVGFAKSKHLQSDATGAKRKQRNGTIRKQYAQIISNKLLSVFFFTKHYNSQTLNKLLGRLGRQKPFVSDDGSPNGECLRCKYKQLCWVHEIRHYKKLFPFFNSHQKEQKQILSQWQHFYYLAKAFRENPKKEKKKQIERLFDQITNQTTNYDLLGKQLRLTKKKKDRLLLFLKYPYIPIHNNQCEQDLRQFVIIRKISGETKSVRGDRSLERHLSIIQTAQKQGLNVYKTLHGLLTNQLSPAVLTANIC